jgi:hypothetical protein
VSTAGLTARLPDVAPPVSKFVPVQDVAFVDDHVSVEELPCVMEIGFAERFAVVAAAAATVTEFTQERLIV